MRLEFYEKSINKLVIALMIFSPFIFFKSATDKFNLPKETFIAVVALLMALCALFYIIDSDKRSLGDLLKPVPMWKPLLGFLLFSWSTQLYTISAAMSLKTNIAITIFMTILFVALMFLKTENLKTFLYILCGVGMLNGIYIIIQYFDLDPLLVVNRAGHGARARTGALIGNPNTAAGYLATILPISLALLFEKGLPSLKRGYIAISALVIAVGLFLTLTFTGIIAAMVAIIVLAFMMIYCRKDRLKVGLVAGALLILAATLLLTVPSPIKHRISALKRKVANQENKLEQILSGRYFVWRATSGVISDFPIFGTGAGTFMNSYYSAHSSIVIDPDSTLMPRHIENVESAHNEYLDLASSHGITGLLLILLVVLVYLAHLLKLSRRLFAEGDPLFYVAVGLVSSIVGVMVNSLANFYFHNPASAVLGVLLIAFSGVLLKEGTFADE